MVDSVLVKFLPFECRLTLLNARRRLSPLASFQQWLKAEEDVSNRNLQDIDFDALTLILQEYFDDFLAVEFQDSFYAPFSYVSLSGINRRMLVEKTNAYENSKLQIESVRTSNLRKRRGGQVINVSKMYDGVAVFTRDGDLRIPSENYVQSKQLQAHADEFNELLFRIRNSPTSSGLDNVASISLSVDVSSGGGNVYTPTQNTNNYDFIIIIAVIVAGCSMVLLGFALYMAFRRKNYNGASPMVQSKLSPRTDTDLSPTSQRHSPPPPVQIMELHPDNDDNISEYTESVYSLPMKAKKLKVKESLSRPKDNNHHISSRFDPRYIISSKRSNDGESDRSSNDDEASFGIPHLAASEKIIERGTNKHHSSEEPTGLYPADIIDDDITSSLSAYEKGLSLLKHGKTQNHDDAVSVSSFESYGFSLDGVGDQSTFAASTKYGY